MTTEEIQKMATEARDRVRWAEDDMRRATRKDQIDRALDDLNYAAYLSDEAARRTERGY